MRQCGGEVLIVNRDFVVLDNNNIRDTLCHLITINLFSITEKADVADEVILIAGIFVLNENKSKINGTKIE